MNEEEIRQVLVDIGYSLSDQDANWYRSSAVYRGGSNPSTLSINKQNGCWKDFKTGDTGSLKDLIRLTLNISDSEINKKFKQLTSSVRVKPSRPKALPEEGEIFSSSIIENFIDDNSYWNERGIADETLEPFRGGVCTAGVMKNRYTFPVFNSNQDLIGITGRYIYNIKEGALTKKWKIKGAKKNWRYPLQVNSKILKKFKKVILVESIGDMLALWQAGYRYVMVTFGTEISLSIINLMLTLDPDEIILSFNDDSGRGEAGNNAAKKEYKKLSKYFDENQLRVCLPSGQNDFGGMSTDEILAWGKINHVRTI
jgi:5S rRNA maturation endonuclease (ribonuclease M5)|tara:strand:+ start:3903 stop:4838 length:936 start_codon:yes stop_codon:yes gene_type:complete